MEKYVQVRSKLLGDPSATVVDTHLKRDHVTFNIKDLLSMDI